ncbi:MAG: hypothetical protein EOP48_07605 [Sphingobacteriales bacterium]|nr:MAG: hypothetical protein EOP48_07605 [Sphingobacteriales bacterium]
MDALIRIVGLTSSLSTLLVLIAFFTSKSESLKKILRWVAIYSAISFLTDFVLQISPEDSNFELLFTFTVLEYGCFAFLFYMLLSKPINQKVVIVGSFAFMVMVTITLMDFGSKQFDNINSGTEAILIIVYSILYFSEKLNIENLEPIFDNPGAFIVIGCLFYLAGNLFLFITSEEQSKSLWIINSLFNLIKNVFFVIAIRKCTRVKKPISAYNFS